jgi:hypothetical protein
VEKQFTPEEAYMRRKLTKLMNLAYNTQDETYSLGHMAGFCLVLALAILNLVYYLEGT